MNNFDFQNSISKKIVEKRIFFKSFLIKFLLAVIFFLSVLGAIMNIISFFGIFEVSTLILKISYIFIALGILNLFIESYVFNRYLEPDRPMALKEAIKDNQNLANYLDLFEVINTYYCHFVRVTITA